MDFVAATVNLLVMLTRVRTCAAHGDDIGDEDGVESRGEPQFDLHAPTPYKPSVPGIQAIQVTQGELCTVLLNFSWYPISV